MKVFAAVLTLLTIGHALGEVPLTNSSTLIVVVGAPGEDQFATNFLHQAQLWRDASAKAGSRCVLIGEAAPEGQGSDHNKLERTLATEPRTGSDPLWLVLIGHGTFDGKVARFNLRGPDVGASELAEWLKPFQRPAIIINTGSASAPFIKALAATNRIVITATRSGNEQNFARFGQFMAEAITNANADLDKDEQISLLEAFLTASRNVARFYKQEGRLVTEHSLIEDNADGLGTSADWYQGLRATKKPTANGAADGLRARQFQLVPGAADRSLTPEQREQRNELERAVLEFRERKGQMPEETYFRELESLLLKLARFYETTRPAPTAAGKSG